MMDDDCRRTAGRLTSYADDGLAAAEREELEHHLNRCAPCRTDAHRETSARQVLRSQARALTDSPLPPGLRTRCEALAREHAAAAVPRSLAVRRFASMTAVVTLVMGFFLFSLATHQSDTVLAAQLTTWCRWAIVRASGRQAEGHTCSCGQSRQEISAPRRGM